MEFINDNFELIVQILVAVLGTLFTVAKGSSYWAKATDWVESKRLGKLWNIALGVCSQMYDEQVRILKEAGEWNDETKAMVKAKAIEIISHSAKDQGIPLAKEFLPMLVEEAVSYLQTRYNKSNGGVTVPFSTGPELD